MKNREAERDLHLCFWQFNYLIKVILYQVLTSNVPSSYTHDVTKFSCYTVLFPEVVSYNIRLSKISFIMAALRSRCGHYIFAL